MLAICDSYASKFHIVFNANKSKCLFLFPSSRSFLNDSQKTCTFIIGGNPIEFVNSFSHLGHLLTNKFTDSSDDLKRRGDFVGQVNSTLCYFCKLTSYLNIGYFNAIVLVFTGVSCGYSPLTNLRICASRGVKLYVESGACRVLLILIFCLYWVNVCLCSMRFPGVQLIFSTLVFRMNPL